jgi:hypothetical protein
MSTPPGHLEVNEPHPAAYDALGWLKIKLTIDPIIVESIASTALSGNRLAEILYETMRRILAGENVSDRYALGLAWWLKRLDELQSEVPSEGDRVATLLRLFDDEPMGQN